VTRLIAVGSAALMLLMTAPAPARASHRPTSYCSESEDVCASTRKEEGIRTLSISLAANYFDRYTLCVTAPDASRECKAFQIEKQPNGVFGDSVRWRPHFPDKGGGPYIVRWRADGFTSKQLGFHVKS
jgi:hypothetical protein